MTNVPGSVLRGKHTLPQIHYVLATYCTEN